MQWPITIRKQGLFWRQSISDEHNSISSTSEMSRRGLRSPVCLCVHPAIASPGPKAPPPLLDSQSCYLFVQKTIAASSRVGPTVSLFWVQTWGRHLTKGSHIPLASATPSKLKPLPITASFSGSNAFSPPEKRVIF